MTDTKTRYLDAMKNRTQITGSDQPSVGKYNFDETMSVEIDVVNDRATIGVNIDAVVSGSGGVPLTAGLVTTTSEPTLTNSRVLTAGPNITINFANGKAEITGSASGSGSGADSAASYVVMSLTSSLANERTLAALNGITLTDNGAGGSAALTLDMGYVKNNLIPLFAPNSASYVVIGATSSMPNERVLTGKNGVDIVDGGAGGNVEISTPFRDAAFLTVFNTGTLPNERLFAPSITGHMVAGDGGPGGSYTLSVNSASLVAYVTQSVDSRYLNTATANVFMHSGVPVGNQKVLSDGPGITFNDDGFGNVTVDLDIAAGPNITINNQAGTYYITGSAGSGADSTANYLIISDATGSLPNSRGISQGSHITLTDNGAGASLNIGVNVSSLTASLDTNYVKRSQVAAHSNRIMFSQAAPIVSSVNLLMQTQLMSQYMGYYLSGTVINNAWFSLAVASTGSTDVTEMGIASSSLGPIGASTTLTILTSSVIATSGVAASLRSTTTPFNFTCSNDMHLWHVIRSNATSGQYVGYGTTAIALFVGGFIQMRKSTSTALSASHGVDVDTWVSTGGNFPIVYWSAY